MTRVSVIGFILSLVSTVYTIDPPNLVVQPLNINNDMTNSDPVLAFVIFRHGDRTPDEEEMALYSTDHLTSKTFFPFGLKALTNKGKQRAFRVGLNIRRRYNGFISKLYLPEEISIRTTDFARTKMTALVALAAMYPPTPAQRWNPMLDWQPIPYDTPVYEEDDLQYWYNCPRYLSLRDKIYELPETKARLMPHKKLFEYLTENAGKNITNPENVFYLDNLFQALDNVGMPPPKWAQDVMPQIKEMTKIEYNIELYNTDLITLASGVLMEQILNNTSAAIAGDLDQPKLRLFSAHENNVAALMAAARVFQPHQPNYGATFSIELRRNRITGKYGIMTIYAPDAGGPEMILPVAGCGNSLLCDYDTFVELTKDIVMSRDEFFKHCPNLE